MGNSPNRKGDKNEFEHNQHPNVTRFFYQERGGGSFWAYDCVGVFLPERQSCRFEADPGKIQGQW